LWIWLKPRSLLISEFAMILDILIISWHFHIGFHSLTNENVAANSYSAQIAYVPQCDHVRTLQARHSIGFDIRGGRHTSDCPRNRASLPAESGVPSKKTQTWQSKKNEGQSEQHLYSEGEKGLNRKGEYHSRILQRLTPTSIEKRLLSSNVILIGACVLLNYIVYCIKHGIKESIIKCIEWAMWSNPSIYQMFSKRNMPDPPHERICAVCGAPAGGVPPAHVVCVYCRGKQARTCILRRPRVSDRPWLDDDRE